MAYACRKKGLELTIYASTSANSLKVERMRSLGARVILHGADFDEAKCTALKQGARFVEDSLDIETLAGWLQGLPFAGELCR